MTPPHFVLGAILVLVGVCVLAGATIIAASAWIVITEHLSTSRAVRARNRMRSHPSNLPPSPNDVR